MIIKISILYSWFVRMVTIMLPNIPIFMRFRGFLYSLMMKDCGKNFQVSSSTVINSLTKLSVGKNVYIGPNTIVIGQDIEINDEVLIGPSSLLSTGNHTMKNDSFRFGPPKRGQIIIGRGAWIAGNCSVVSGAILPAASVLAAGSVLNKAYMESHSMYAGVPAKYIKKL
ncbi:acyltransferase [Pontibacter sp. HSC-36F09]|uniref:acyltransferase n=1 Tax=Pontibacter sp. HSC-36F09 TaxID=2910966 RepID=UPI0020A112EA|nr:acyltransferase [Pontibacter sp. HSC-36F09]MCP2044257.1 maltose O-acetyltransferase [Pontibacter sp. HSC-36F09]